MPVNEKYRIPDKPGIGQRLEPATTTSAFPTPLDVVCTSPSLLADDLPNSVAKVDYRAVHAAPDDGKVAVP